VSFKATGQGIIYGHIEQPLRTALYGSAVGICEIATPILEFFDCQKSCFNPIFVVAHPPNKKTEAIATSKQIFLFMVKSPQVLVVC